MKDASGEEGNAAPGRKYLIDRAELKSIRCRVSFKLPVGSLKPVEFTLPDQVLEKVGSASDAAMSLERVVQSLVQELLNSTLAQAPRALQGQVDPSLIRSFVSGAGPTPSPEAQNAIQEALQKKDVEGLVKEVDKLFQRKKKQ